jgi:hypothetical protein
VDEEFYPKKDYHTVYFAELVKTVGKNQELVENH